MIGKDRGQLIAATISSSWSGVMKLQKDQVPSLNIQKNSKSPNSKSAQPFGTSKIVISLELGIWSFSKLHYSHASLLHFLSVCQKAAGEIIPRRLS